MIKNKEQWNQCNDPNELLRFCDPFLTKIIPIDIILKIGSLPYYDLLKIYCNCILELTQKEELNYFYSKYSEINEQCGLSRNTLSNLVKDIFPNPFDDFIEIKECFNCKNLVYIVPKNKEDRCYAYCAKCCKEYKWDDYYVYPKFKQGTIDLVEGILEKNNKHIMENSEMSILADYLEENDIRDQIFIDHLRTHPLHTRGCWMINLIKGTL